MHSLVKIGVVAGALVVASVHGAVLAPVITEAPRAQVVEERQDPDAISLAQILLTAVPVSLRQIAATNLPAVSSILWEEFLDDKKPEWFVELPWEVQNYLIRKFGPQSAWPTGAPASSGAGGGASGSGTVTASATSTVTDEPAESSQTIPSGSSEGASQTDTQATATATTSAASTEPSASTAASDKSSRPTLSPTSFATSYTSATTQSSTFHSQTHTTSSSTGSAKPSETRSSTPIHEAPASSSESLSKSQKIGLGVGIPIGLLAAATLVLGCCVLCRRRKKKNVEGSIPPASPGFIPRFAFQERSVDNLEHRMPLTRDMSHEAHDVGVAWNDEGVDSGETARMQNQNPSSWNDPGPYGHPSAAVPAATATATEYTALDNDIGPNKYSNVPMMVHDPKPIMAPALFHTHSSNRARGKRTSYTSLHSVAEVSEPEESPILGRHVSPEQRPARNLIPSPSMPAIAHIKRKPMASSPSPITRSPAAQADSHKLLRQTMPDHSGSSSSGLALTPSSGVSSTSGLGPKAEATSPTSPISNRAPSNPFLYDSYTEDCGPEYHNGYVDVEDSLYGGNTSLSKYPEPRRKNSKTEWPLRNLVGSRHRRKSSPLWDRIYEE